MMMEVPGSSMLSPSAGGWPGLPSRDSLSVMAPRLLGPTAGKTSNEGEGTQEHGNREQRNVNRELSARGCVFVDTKHSTTFPVQRPCPLFVLETSTYAFHLRAYLSLSLSLMYA